MSNALPLNIDPEDPEDVYKKFWEDILGPDNNIDVDGLKIELCDYFNLIENVPKVYETITGGLISKPHTDADEVIARFNDYVDELVQEAIAEREFEITSWEVETFQTGDVIFFKMEKNLTQQARYEFNEKVQEFLKSQPTVQAIMIPADMDVLYLKESEMNKLGWYKK